MSRREEYRGNHKVGPWQWGCVSKIQKKWRWVQKSYLEASHGVRNVLNVKFGSQLLWDNNHLSNQLHFELRTRSFWNLRLWKSRFPDFSIGILWGNFAISKFQSSNRSSSKLKRCWFYCPIVIVTRTLRWARFWARGKTPVVFCIFETRAPPWSCESLWLSREIIMTADQLALHHFIS